MPVRKPHGDLWCATCLKRVPATHFYPASGKPRCASVLVWTPARRWKLMTLIERGLSDEQAAAKLGVSRHAIVLARKRYGIKSALQVNYSARDVAALLV